MAVLFFTSPIGLGHASRDVAVAGHMDLPRFVSGGPAAEFLSSYGFEVDDPYEPPAFHVKDGRLRGRAAWMAKYYAYYRRCKGMAADAMERYRPDLVVSDEDFAAVAVARARGIPAVLITDILESRFLSGPAAIIERRMNAAMRKMASHCVSVIMPETGRDIGNVCRVGHIVRETRSSRERLRQKYGMDRKTVLVTVGGTGAGAFLLDAMARVSPRLDGVDTRVAAGPVLGGGAIKDLHEMIYAADAVVSLAGRSTMDEAFAYGTPGVFIPIRGHFEQEDNARRAGCSHGDLERLYDTILERLAARRGPVDLGGARRAAEIIAGAQNNA